MLPPDPHSVDENVTEIKAVRNMVECEIAALVNDERLKQYGLINWEMKTTATLNVVRKIGADGKVDWVIPHLPAPTFVVTPSVEAGRNDTRVSELEFASDIPKAATRLKDICVNGIDPSGTGLGLATYVEATLLAVELYNHGGVTFTSEFEIVTKASARFGYTIVNATTNVGPSFERSYTNKVVVTIGPPSPKPRPQQVFVTNFPPRGNLEGLGPPPPSPGLQQQRPRQNPALDSPRLNRLQDRQVRCRGGLC